jgi:signal transduction histidine kinase
MALSPSGRSPGGGPGMDGAAAKLFEISVTLSEPVELDEVLKRVRLAVIEGLGFDRCGIFILDEAAGLLRGTWGTDPRGELEDISHEVHSMEDTGRAIIQVARGERPCFVTENLEELARAEGLPHYPGMRGVHANACLPLRARGRVVGVLGVDNVLTDRPIHEAELEAVAPFAAQAAIAIDNAILMERLTAREQERQRLFEAVEAERERLELAFAQTRQRLVEATRLATIGEMSATIAHELRNPLHVLQLNHELLQQCVGGQGERVDACLSRMAQYLERAQRIIHDLLAFAREGQLQSQSLCPGLLLWEIADSLPLPATITLTLETADPLLTVEADALQLHQALRNVAVNALEAMPEGGTLSLIVAPVKDGVEFRVRDTGIGMSPEQLARACEPLFTTKKGGTGLGLALVRRVAEAHGGHLSFESGPDCGTTARLWLPMSGAEQPSIPGLDDS